LLLTVPIERACEEAGLSKQTVYTWLKQEAFKNEIRRCQDELMENAMQTLKANVTKAAQTLVKHLDSEKENISIRAAERIIEFAQRSVETEDLEHRIQTLEQKNKEQA